MRRQSGNSSGRLRQLSLAKLSHDTLLGHLLHRDIENNAGSSVPVVFIPPAQARNPAGVSRLHPVRTVRLPYNLIVLQLIKLHREGLVAVFNLLARVPSLQIDKLVSVPK